MRRRLPVKNFDTSPSPRGPLSVPVSETALPCVPGRGFFPAAVPRRGSYPRGTPEGVYPGGGLRRGSEPFLAGKVACHVRGWLGPSGPTPRSWKRLGCEATIMITSGDDPFMVLIPWHVPCRPVSLRSRNYCQRGLCPPEAVKKGSDPRADPRADIGRAGLWQRALITKQSRLRGRGSYAVWRLPNQHMVPVFAASSALLCQHSVTPWLVWRFTYSVRFLS